MAHGDIHYGYSHSLDSTYLMIEKAMEYNRAFDSLAKQDSNYIYAPSVKDWEKAAVLCKVLKVFYDATM
jgi:hypothetical protein